MTFRNCQLFPAEELQLNRKYTVRHPGNQKEKENPNQDLLFVATLELFD